MRRKLDRLGSSLRVDDGPGSGASLADASRPVDNPVDKTRHRNKRRTATLKRRKLTSSPLGILSQDGDKTLDLTAVHDAVAILLMRYHQRLRSQRATGDLT